MTSVYEKSGDLRALFEEALEIAPQERTEWLITHCEDVDDRRAIERLIAADDLEHATIVDDSFDALLGEVGKIEVDGPPAGSRIGGFTLLEKLGEGGSSVVFLAHREQTGVIQRVALKLLRRNLYTADEQRRFRDERRALSQLDHPGIARLIEGGLTDSGTPYIALELVEGESIIAYASKQSLDTAGRLKLFVAVCRAVEAAHRALIVHRDLKPSNVMVTSRGEVKLLDFGIAKLLDSEDIEPTQNRPMTPAYAAPEQFAGGQITTATDVYALGVMLRELITGRRHASGDSRTPSAQVDDASAAEAHAASARALRRQLRGDLDNIALKAMAADPENRYASAGSLADDVERHLDGQPVSAHPPSRWYRANKFIGRHRGGVATTALLVLAVLASLAIAITQARSARQEALRANTVRDFVVGLFDTASAHLPRDQRPTPEALVEQAQRKLAQPSSLDAGTQADLLRTLGEVSLSLSSFSRAESLFEQAQSLAQAHGDIETVRDAQVLRADALQRAARNAEAMNILSPLLTELGKKPSATLLRAYSVIAAAELELGKPEQAIAYRRNEEDLAKTLFGSESTEALAAGFETGGALTLLEKYPEAIATLEPLLARWRSLHIAEDDRYVEAFSNLAIASNGVGDAAADEARFRELLALKKRIYTAPHDSIARTLQDLAAILLREERYAEAEELLNESLTMQRLIFGENHGEIATTYNVMGSLMSAQRHFPEADANYRAAISVCENAKLKQDICISARNNLGQSFYSQNRLDEAKQELTRGLQESRALLGDDSPYVAYSMTSLANVAVKQGDFKMAVQMSGDALDILKRNGRMATREAAQIRNGYALALLKDDRPSEALQAIDQSLADWQRVEPQGKTRHVMMLVLKAQILNMLDRGNDARAAAKEAIAVNANHDDLPEKTRELVRSLSGDETAYADTPPSIK